MPTNIPFSLDGIDQDLSRVDRDKQSHVSFSLEAIKALQEKPMLESALIQWAVSTWRNPKIAELSIESGDGKVELSGLEQLAVSAPSVTLALLPHGKLKNISRKQSADFREKYLVGQRSWPDLAVSSSAAIYCLDAYPRLLPPKLYISDEPPRLMEWNGFRTLLDAMIDSVSGEHQIKTRMMLMSKSICEILYELFKNTHDHGRQGLNNQELGDSLRGVYMRFFPVQSLEWLDRQSDDQQMARNTLERELAPSIRAHFRGDISGRKSSLSGFLELSVFDTGPGLAAKWIASNPSCKNQYEAVLACFEKGASTTSDTTKGYGLWKVLKTLDELQGCIRVRTNNMHLFRGFAFGVGPTAHMDGGPDIPESKLFDWKRGLTSKVSDYPNVEGTLVSVMLPMEEA
jgi:hypothetical protein